MLVYLLVYWIGDLDLPHFEYYRIFFSIMLFLLVFGLYLVYWPKGRIVIKKWDNSILITLHQNRKSQTSFSIIGFEHWWNYKFGNNVYYNENGDYRRGGSGSMYSVSDENRINLNVVLHGEESEVVNLYECLNVWKHLPSGWGYRVNSLLKTDYLSVTNLERLLETLKDAKVPSMTTLPSTVIRK